MTKISKKNSNKTNLGSLHNMNKIFVYKDDDHIIALTSKEAQFQVNFMYFNNIAFLKNILNFQMKTSIVCFKTQEPFLRNIFKDQNQQKIDFSIVTTKSFEKVYEILIKTFKNKDFINPKENQLFTCDSIPDFSSKNYHLLSNENISLVKSAPNREIQAQNSPKIFPNHIKGNAPL